MGKYMHIYLLIVNKYAYICSAIEICIIKRYKVKV